MGKAVPFQINSHVVDFPEASEEHKVTFLQASATYGTSAAVVVHLASVMGQAYAIMGFVELHHVAGTVGTGLGAASVNVGGANPGFSELLQR